jgi:hypothetical protein
MADLKRHIGKIKNTDRRCVVVYMQIPNLETHSLIIDTDALPDSFHEWVMDVVESEVGQSSTNLADILSRRPSPDSNADLLNALHQRGCLQRQPIDNIIMLPRPNMPMPLRGIIENMNKNAKKSPPQIKTNTSSEEKYNRVAENMQIDASEQQMQMAANILREALDLEREANRKKAQAYKIVPQLDPNYQSPINNSIAKSDLESNNVLPRLDPVVEEIEDPEMIEILRRAQEHLDRAAYREDHPMIVTEQSRQSEQVEEPKKSRGRPKKSDDAAAA